jgi:hypothetical protein
VVVARVRGGGGGSHGGRGREASCGWVAGAGMIQII